MSVDDRMGRPSCSHIFITCSWACTDRLVTKFKNEELEASFVAEPVCEEGHPDQRLRLRLSMDADGVGAE